MTETIYEKNYKSMPKIGDNVEGVVIANERNRLYIDLAPFGTGIIFGREYLIIKDLIKDMVPGVRITAKVIDTEGEDGYIELSLKEAKEAEVWKEASEAMKEKKVIPLIVKEANRGGLMINWKGLIGFLPVSQLKEEHYPNVAGGDKNRILAELEKLVGKKLNLNIITVEPAEKKLIFSEKTVNSENSLSEDAGPELKNDKEESMVKKYSIGDVLEAEVIGVVDFGVFVKLPRGDEGLVHISELSWSLISDPKTLYKIGDKLTVKVIEINDNKVSLSVKALTENPWKKVGNKYKKDDEVKAVVIKISEHGALVSVEEGIYGLVHVSEFKDLDELKEKLKLGNSYNFKIKVFDVEAEKMTLTLID